MSKELTAAEILAAEDMQMERVEVEEWGGHVWVRTLPGYVRDAWEASMINLRRAPGRRRGKGRQEDASSAELNLANARAKLCARAMCNKDGERLFTDVEVKALGEKSSVALDRVYEAAQALNRMTDEDVQELVKNSEADQSDGSGSG